ncbi:MAG: ABC transporter permease [Chloroflexi bacterium]|uniref:Maltose ABC transporter permease n=1 Tax=Candidatus Thermofonsia Clade 3 bacterium TaxID=2364212 RepID=A0A2M8QEZ3_9CHLR|nr:ABC transporter permease [Candidatus Roseilinea sp. NK_OTU-006]PJF48322.1 MAG: maltose ABC transporter permease [Candidatus Thermofonsia Clade 3 bacterium]RMG62677.1 MAG: ABC transporter permease [Chloroflexota bacterium]
MAAVGPQPDAQEIRYEQPSRLTLTGRYLRRNKSLVLGLAIVIALTLFTVIGSLTIDTEKRAYPLAVKPKQPPSAEYPLGTDFFGRDLLAVMVRGIWQTAVIGLIAGAIGTGVGVILGFLSAYYGGVVDTLIRAITEVLLPIPAFLILVIIAGSIDRKSVTIYTMALIVSLLAWMGPTRVMRAQVLTLKERLFVNVARLSGMSNLEIVFKEILPNMLPFILASFVSGVFAGIFASFGLSVLGLGPLREPLIGNTIWFAQQQAAFFNGWWWWPLWPSLALVLIFVSLTLINVGLDELANPRVRRAE